MFSLFVETDFPLSLHSDLTKFTEDLPSFAVISDITNTNKRFTASALFLRAFVK